jgi:hypothetical protein
VAAPPGAAHGPLDCAPICDVVCSLTSALSRDHAASRGGRWCDPPRACGISPRARNKGALDSSTPGETGVKVEVRLVPFALQGCQLYAADIVGHAPQADGVAPQTERLSRHLSNGRGLLGGGNGELPSGARDLRCNLLVLALY